MIKFAHIVARSVNGVIGNNGEIPWKIKQDLQFFKEKTTNNICIVGRKTYEGISHLKNRTFIVITSSTSYTDTDNAFFVNSIETAVSLAKEKFVKSKMSMIYIIGGAEIYRETFEYADILYVTEIEKAMDGDATYFVNENYKLIESSDLHSENKIPFYFSTYKKVI